MAILENVSTQNGEVIYQTTNYNSFPWNGKYNNTGAYVTANNGVAVVVCYYSLFVNGVEVHRSTVSFVY